MEPNTGVVFGAANRAVTFSLIRTFVRSFGTMPPITPRDPTTLVKPVSDILLDNPVATGTYWEHMQLSVNSHRRSSAKRQATLAELREGQEATLEHLDLPDDMSRRLMELGFLPGHIIAAARSAPSGDPRVFRVDGSEVALRRETASKLHIKLRE
jgi:Fe2+ transport system protein FeoA